MGGKNKGFIEVYRQGELEDGSKPADYIIQIILCSPLEFAEFRMAGLPDFIVSIRAIACLPPTTFPQVFDMRVRCSTTRLHLLEFLFMLTSHLAGSSHFCLLRRKNGLDSHSPRAAYRLWYVPISLSTDNISSTQKRVDPPVGRQEDIVILARPTGHRRGALHPLGTTIYPQQAGSDR